MPAFSFSPAADGRYTYVTIKVWAPYGTQITNVSLRINGISVVGMSRGATLGLPAIGDLYVYLRSDNCAGCFRTSDVIQLEYTSVAPYNIPVTCPSTSSDVYTCGSNTTDPRVSMHFQGGNLGGACNDTDLVCDFGNPDVGGGANPNRPDTANNGNMSIYAGVLIVGLLAIAFVLMCIKRRKNK